MPTPKLRKKSRRVQSRSRPRPRSRSRSKSRRVRSRSRRKPRVKTRSKPRSKRIRGGITKKTAALTLGVGAVGTGVAWTLKHGSEQARPEEARPEEARPELSYEYYVQSLISEIKHALRPSTKTTPSIINMKDLEDALLDDNLDLFFTECAKNPGVTQICTKVKTSSLINRNLLERLKSVFYEEDLNYLLSEITEKVEGNKDAQETLNTLLSSVEDVKFNPSDFYRSLVCTLQLRLLKFPRFLDALDVPYNDFKVKKFLRDLYELSRSKE